MIFDQCRVQYLRKVTLVILILVPHGCANAHCASIWNYTAFEYVMESELNREQFKLEMKRLLLPTQNVVTSDSYLQFISCQFWIDLWWSHWASQFVRNYPWILFIPSLPSELAILGCKISTQSIIAHWSSCPTSVIWSWQWSSILDLVRWLLWTGLGHQSMTISATNMPSWWRGLEVSMFIPHFTLSQ